MSLFLALTVATATVGGDATIRLDRAEVVRRAASQNPKVAATRAEIYRAEARAGQVRAAHFPDVSLIAGVATGLKGQLTDRLGAESVEDAYDFQLRDLSATFATQIQVIQPLYTFGKIDLRGQAVEHSLRAAEAQVNITEGEVALEAAKLYEAHIFANAILLFLDDIEDIAARSLEDTEALLEEQAPDVKVQDKLRLQAAQHVARIARAQAEAGADQSREGLRAYLALDPNAKIEVADEYLDPIAPVPSRLEELVDLAVNNRPEFKALSNGIQAIEHLAEAERADYFPDIFLLGYLSAAYTPGRDWIRTPYVFDPMGHVVPTLALGARWTIQWDAAGHRADEVLADAHKYAGLLAWAQQGVPAQVNKSYQDVLRYRKAIKEADEGIPLTKQWLVRASADYGAGIGPSREITDAVEAYVLLKFSQLEAVYMLNVSLAELAAATGTLVSGSSLYPGKTN